MQPLPGKTVGLSIGAGGALAYAKHATTDTMYLLGWDQLPPEALDATRELLTGAWGVLIVLLSMWIGHMMNKAAAAWGQADYQQPPRPDA
jgi:hypothetical protein